MINERIIFGDSKAIKITSEMRKALDSFNNKRKSSQELKDQVADLEKTIVAKENEKAALNINSEDKKEAKEATKKQKAIEK